MRKLELVPTLFGFLTTGFLAGLDKVFFWAWGSWEVHRCALKVRVLDRQSMIGLCASSQSRPRMMGWWGVEMMLKTIFSVCLLIQNSRGVVSCVIAPKAMVLPSITSTGTGVDFLITRMLCWTTNVWSMKEEVAPKSTKIDTCGMSSRIRMMSTYWVKLGLGPTAEQEPLQRWCWVRSSRTAPTMTGCSCFPTLGGFPQLVLEVWQAFEGTDELYALGCHSKNINCLSFGEVSRLLSKI